MGETKQKDALSNSTMADGWGELAVFKTTNAMSQIAGSMNSHRGGGLVAK